MKRRRALHTIAPMALLAVSLLAASGGTAAPPPLTDEDIVRMLAAGRSSEEIVRAIEAGTAAFDLSDEMVAEMRLAGVSDRVVEAMRKRQAETSPPAPRPEPGTRSSEVPRPVIRVRLSARRGALHAPDRADDDTARALRLDPTPEARTITGVAVFLACTTADHVPDQWRAKSPLGRDFVSMPRHEMLALRASVTHVPGGRAARVPFAVPRTGRRPAAGLAPSRPSRRARSSRGGRGPRPRRGNRDPGRRPVPGDRARPAARRRRRARRHGPRGDRRPGGRPCGRCRGPIRGRGARSRSLTPSGARR